MGDPQLLGVPLPCQFEAVSAWLPRLTLSQGSDLKSVADLLGLDLTRDVDRQMTGPRLARVRAICGLPSESFAIAERLMESLDLIEPVGRRFMIHVKAGRGRYRFCPCCLAQARPRHFPIHWRFVAWRRCPEHDCLLEDGCPHCGAPIRFPTDLELAPAGRMGHAGLDRCMTCGQPLTSVEPCWLQVDGRRVSSPWDEMQMANGRALLAALYAREFKVEGQTSTSTLRAIGKIRDWGVFPVRFRWPHPGAARTGVAAASDHP